MAHDRMALAFLAVCVRIKAFCGPLPKNSHVFNEPGWLKILKLLAELCIISLKLRLARRRLIKVRRKTEQILLEQSELLLQQRNHLILEARSSDSGSDVFDDLNCSHAGFGSGSENSLANVKEHATLSAGASVDHGVEV